MQIPFDTAPYNYYNETTLKIRGYYERRNSVYRYKQKL